MTAMTIDDATLRRILPVREAIAALDRFLTGGPAVDTPARQAVLAPAGEVLIMPAVSDAGVGVKLVGVARGNAERGLPVVQGHYVLLDPVTLAVRAHIDGTALTLLRTSAVSAWVTDRVARPDAERLVLFGTGPQAAAHLEAIASVRTLSEVVVVARRADRGAAMVEQARRAGLPARAGGPDAVRHADVVCCCTSSTTPVFDGDLLPPGAHVVAMGAHHPDYREVDDTTIVRSRVVVETRAAALAEAGAVVVPLRAGLIGADHIVADLAEVAAGVTVRRRPEDRTTFVSVGAAFEDLAVALAAVDAARSGTSGTSGASRPAITLRAARADEVDRLRAVEVEAGARFRAVGMAEVADDPPPPAAELEAFRLAGRAWVAVDEAGRVIGYALAELVDGRAHLAQVSVVPDAGGRGVGRALVEHVCRWATERGDEAVTLTTFADIPWNRPFYERCGFAVVRTEELSAALAAVVQAEAARGLDPDARVVMRRSLRGDGAGTSPALSGPVGSAW